MPQMSPGAQQRMHHVPPGPGWYISASPSGQKVLVQHIFIVDVALQRLLSSDCRLQCSGACHHGIMLFLTLRYVTCSTQQGAGTPLGANERLIVSMISCMNVIYDLYLGKQVTWQALFGASAEVLLWLVNDGRYRLRANSYPAAGLRNQIRLVGVYGQLVGLRLPLYPKQELTFEVPGSGKMALVVCWSAGVESLPQPTEQVSACCSWFRLLIATHKSCST
jgi:hypothetical protein